jgi:hypothetical protein
VTARSFADALRPPFFATVESSSSPRSAQRRIPRLDLRLPQSLDSTARRHCCRPPLPSIRRQVESLPYAVLWSWSRRVIFPVDLADLMRCSKLTSALPSISRCAQHRVWTVAEAYGGSLASGHGHLRRCYRHLQVSLSFSVLLLWDSITHDCLVSSLPFSFHSEMGNGANFALVPHCNAHNNGVMSGLVGAMGNAG